MVRSSASSARSPGASVPRVSVALCTYNGFAFIEEQLRSILGQTEPAGEIVVSDDGSTDGTPEAVDRIFAAWQGEHPGQPVTLRVIRNPAPLGVTANFEQALAACAGELIALSDQDDVWPPERLALLRAEFRARPGLQLLHTDARLVDEIGRPTGRTLLATLGVSAAEQAAEHEGHAFDLLLRRNIVTGATAMLRRGLVQRACPFPAAWVHDEWLAIVAAATGEVDLLALPLLDYRQHAGNQIGASSLDAAGKLGRLRAPRTARNARLLARAQALQARAAQLQPSPSADTLALIDAKLAHERRRSTLPPLRAARVASVFASWRAGDYRRFGLGLQDVVRDLAQPV
ncbi:MULTISPECIES: glycosyltransferase family 2 protein [Cryobacterium]|uniref:Glycosyltransferase family 2 protein n=1 Tax=Cryobacterium breve TaxID=1259258 RepID=A0ABY2JDU3_9MICO|nr:MULTISPECIES: glycosyltransferase family 2 protein [Cryobacterium]TFC90405.1 glycosyltransferase family 2 protein [Cryobacterium sp. TmT3-12]TFD01822.1 glycosyltransferase family 2 protein [Cryobacterium breve]